MTGIFKKNLYHSILLPLGETCTDKIYVLFLTQFRGYNWYLFKIKNRILVEFFSLMCVLIEFAIPNLTCNCVLEIFKTCIEKGRLHFFLRISKHIDKYTFKYQELYFWKTSKGRGTFQSLLFENGETEN